MLNPEKVVNFFQERLSYIRPDEFISKTYRPGNKDKQQNLNIKTTRPVKVKNYQSHREKIFFSLSYFYMSVSIIISGFSFKIFRSVRYLRCCRF